MFKKILLAAVVGGSTFLTACGGGGSGSSVTPPPAPSDDGGDGIVVSKAVSGPLDPVQAQLSDGVFAPLASGVAGTPLEGVVACADQVVAQDLLDISDTVLAHLQAQAQGAAGGTGMPDPQALAESLESLVVDLRGLLDALAGLDVSCLATSLPLGQFASGNPLAGSPLEALGTALMPILAQTAATLDAQQGSAQPLDVASLSLLISRLQTALDNGLALIPAEAYDAPVVGGVLTTLSAALADCDDLLTAALSLDPQALQTQLQATVDQTLGNLLTQVVPVGVLEDNAGQPGAVTAGLIENVHGFASTMIATVGTVTDAVLPQALEEALAPVLDPVLNDVLPTLVDAIFNALAGGGVEGGAGVFEGTPLQTVVSTVSNVLATLFAPITGGGEGGTEGECALAGVPFLSILCGI